MQHANRLTSSMIASVVYHPLSTGVMNIQNIPNPNLIFSQVQIHEEHKAKYQNISINVQIHHLMNQDQTLPTFTNIYSCTVICLIVLLSFEATCCFVQPSA